MGFPGGSNGKESVCNVGVRKTPWKREWQFTPLLLPGKFHGERSLAGGEGELQSIGQKE